jgi:hypothetical protein
MPIIFLPSSLNAQQLRLLAAGFPWSEEKGLFEDPNGKVVKRETCEFNRFSDVRHCVDFDRGTAHQDMKDANGNWMKIEDQ